MKVLIDWRSIFDDIINHSYWEEISCFCHISVSVFFLFFCSTPVCFAQSRTATIIESRDSVLRNGENVSLTISAKILGAYGNEQVNRGFQLDTVYNQPIHNHSFKFVIDSIKDPIDVTLQYIDFKDRKFTIGQTFIVRPGDSVNMSWNGNSFVFSGRGSSRYNCLHELSILSDSAPQLWSTKAIPSNFDYYFTLVDSFAEASLQLVDKYKTELNSDDYWLLRAKVIIGCQTAKYYFVNDGTPNFVISKLNDAKIIALKRYGVNPIWNDGVRNDFIGNPVISHYLEFLDFLIAEHNYKSIYELHKPEDLSKAYSYFVQMLNGPVREWAIYRLINKFPLDVSSGLCIKDALDKGYIKNTSIKERMLYLLKNFVPGATAYNFSLKDVASNTVRLSDLKGNVVLIDFWYIGCGGCISIHPYLDSIRNQLKDEKFKLVSICLSVNDDGNTRKKWINAIKEDKYTSPQNLNLNAPGKYKRYHEVASRYEILGCPSIFLIDKEGRFIQNPLRPEIDQGKELMTLIKKNL
ncbi:peroxiredoxin family protein [Chitinophaga vietnamensis]|uniref:peroxiredoxin family protein n=1 Tax=Chitinophaga vietnamensis TaxID=2593957 RepID=UPI00137558B9|nr:TlpA disulfide reductase family protein [Chitinophaga vietnamensis]